MDDFYKILGVTKNASDAEIKKAYRKLAHEHHPDKGGGKTSEEKFKKITQAYEVLGDKQKRAQYDQFGSAGGPGGFGGNAGGFGGYGNFGGFENVQFDFGNGNFSDIFDSFFGGNQTRSKKKSGPSRGNDIEVAMTISFEEAVFGATHEVSISRYETCQHCEGKGAEPGTKISTCTDCSGTGQKIKMQRTILGQIQTAVTCPACQGSGKVPEKKCKVCSGEGRKVEPLNVNVKIPAGIHDQAVLRIKDKGEAGIQGGPYGDLFVHIQVQPSSEFERKGDDIYTQQTLHTVQAILGDEVDVKTIHGNIKLKIPAGTDSGKTFKLKEYGVSHVGGAGKGDHYVTFIIDTPKKLSRKERELYEALAKEAKLNLKPNTKGLFG